MLENVVWRNDPSSHSYTLFSDARNELIKCKRLMNKYITVDCDDIVEECQGREKEILGFLEKIPEFEKIHTAEVEASGREILSQAEQDAHSYAQDVFSELDYYYGVQRFFGGILFDVSEVIRSLFEDEYFEIDLQLKKHPLVAYMISYYEYAVKGAERPVDANHLYVLASLLDISPTCVEKQVAELIELVYSRLLREDGDFGDSQANNSLEKAIDIFLIKGGGYVPKVLQAELKYYG